MWNDGLEHRHKVHSRFTPRSSNGTSVETEGEVDNCIKINKYIRLQCLWWSLLTNHIEAIC